MAIYKLTEAEAGVELVVYEPENVKPGEKCKSLWLLHGMFGQPEEWFAKTKVLEYIGDAPVYVFCPAGDVGFYTDCPYGINWQTKIMGRAWDYVHERFPLSDEREDCCIGGFSMGGYGAMRYGLFYPERFGYVGCFAGGVNLPQRYAGGEDIMGKLGACFGPADKVLGSEYDLIAKAKASADAIKARMFMCVGYRDPHENGPNQEYRDLLRSLGYDVAWDEGDWDHSYEFVDNFLPQLIKMWLG